MASHEEPLLDLKKYGRLVKAARIMKGYESASLACRAIKEQTGLHVTERALYSIERGEQMPSAEQYLAIGVTLNPVNGWDFFHEAMSHIVTETLGGARGDA